MRARREVTTDGEVKTLHERKIIEAAVQALGKSFNGNTSFKLYMESDSHQSLNLAIV